jgi:hypothetical protein
MLLARLVTTAKRLIPCVRALHDDLLDDLLDSLTKICLFSLAPLFPDRHVLPPRRRRRKVARGSKQGA